MPFFGLFTELNTRHIKRLHHIDVKVQLKFHFFCNESVIWACLSTNSIRFNFIYKAHYHKSRFTSEGFTAYDITLSLETHSR